MKYKLIIILVLSVLLLSACMYPQEERNQNQPPHPEQIQSVQAAVDRFYSATGVWPIFNFEAETPLYQRYALDFNRLTPNYLNEPPGHSYEKGGIYRYVLIEVEQQPVVKLIDLRHSREVGELQRKVHFYLSRGNYLPIDQVLEDGYFTLKYEELGLDSAPTVRSPFTQQNLPLIVNMNGLVGIDYRIDIQQVMMNDPDLNLEEGSDIRYLLHQDREFVPGHSFPVIYQDGEPHLKKRD